MANSQQKWPIVTMLYYSTYISSKYYTKYFNNAPSKKKIVTTKLVQQPRI